MKPLNQSVEEPSGEVPATRRLPFDSQSLRHYGFGVLGIAVALGFQAALNSLLGNRASIAPVLLVVILTAGYSGFGPALLATALGTLGLGYFLAAPAGKPQMYSTAAQIEIAIFVLAGVTAALASKLHPRRSSSPPVSDAEVVAQQQLLDDEIVSRRRAEEIGAQFAAIIESSEDAIIGMSLEGTVRSWNPAAERLFGYSSAEITGESIEVLVPAEYSHTMPELMNRLTRGDHIKHYETVRLRKDGRLVDVSLGISPIKDTAGEVIGVSTIARDITERKQGERRQSAQHAITRILAESATLSDAAPKVLKAIGESVRWMVGILWTDDKAADVLRCAAIWHSPFPKSNDLATATRQAEPTKSQGLPGRVWVVGKHVWLPDFAKYDGSPRTAAAQACGMRAAFGFPIQLGSETLGVIEFLNPEITEPDPTLLAMMVALSSQLAQYMERKRTEERLRQAEEQVRQAQKMEAIGRLAGGIAHDFNNLLTGILGYSDLVLSSISPANPEYEEVVEIRKAADRAALLTRQLLAFSRKQVLALKVLDVNSILTGTEKMLQRLIGEDVHLVLTLAPNLDKVKADPGQIEQVIVNLAVNARDAMPQGGRLVLETANVDLDERITAERPEISPGRYVRITVNDTGCGMDKATQARLFEPFFTTKEVGKGTGLGLATVYGITKQFGGHIEVESEPGKGTTFRIHLPRCAEIAPLRKSYPGLRKAPGGQETVLLVEDEEVVRSLARKTLEKCGYTVLEASQGAEALQMAERHRGPIHLLLSDVVMPGMAGSLLAQRLTALRPEMKVLYMSGYTDDAMIRHGVSEDAVDLLPKPFTPMILANKIREVLDQPDSTLLGRMG